VNGALADRSETKGAREQLSKHLMKMYIAGEKDEHRLTVEGLSYLRNLDREIPQLVVVVLGSIPSRPPAVSVKSCAAFPPSRCGLLPTILALVVAPSLVFRSLASSSVSA
jgi:hypothetical protein